MAPAARNPEVAATPALPPLDARYSSLTPQCISKVGQLPDSAYTESELSSNPGGARERYFAISVAPRLVSVPVHAHPRFVIRPSAQDVSGKYPPGEEDQWPGSRSVRRVGAPVCALEIRRADWR